MAKVGAPVTLAVLLFGVGSPIVVDYEESLYRLGWSVVAGIKNRALQTYLSPEVRVIPPDAIDDALRTVPFIVPIFTPSHRATASREAQAVGLTAACAMIDPTSIVPRTLDLGAGSYINAGCTLGSASRIGQFALINRGVSMGHDATIGDYVSIGPGAVVAGNVTIGAMTMLGAGCTVLPSITIGRDAKIAAGAVVTRDVPPCCTVVGNPARIVGDDREAVRVA